MEKNENREVLEENIQRDVGKKFTPSMADLKFTNGNYTMAVDNFLFKRRWGSLINELTDEQAGQLIKAIYGYIEGKRPVLDPETEFVFVVMARQLNYSCWRYVLRMNNRRDQKEETP